MPSKRVDREKRADMAGTPKPVPIALTARTIETLGHPLSQSELTTRYRWAYDDLYHYRNDVWASKETKSEGSPYPLLSGGNIHRRDR